ncbi:MAG: hypothetical protein ACPGU4_01410 [Flavobacteriales bacterium]
MEEVKTFFVLSLGRTGTKFLSNLLNGVNDFYVQHEPWKADTDILFYSYSGQFDEIVNQMLDKRFKTLTSGLSKGAGYGECNSYLRYNGIWLKENLNAQLIYTCRNGRDYVRSAYQRTLYTDYELQLSIVPKTDNSYAKSWGRLKRFEKICWYWAETNRHLYEESNGNIFQIEKILTDYSFFHRSINEQLGISITEETWSRSVANPKNSSSKLSNIKRKVRAGLKAKDIGNTLPTSENWSQEMNIAFDKICGPVMKNLGYSA